MPNQSYTPQSMDGVTVPFDSANHWQVVGGYDGAGNTTSVRTQTMGYDAESRMIAWADSATGTGVSFTYDGDGRRVTKTSGAGRRCMCTIRRGMWRRSMAGLRRGWRGRCM